MIVACQVMGSNLASACLCFSFVFFLCRNKQKKSCWKQALEPPTPRSEVWCAIHCATRAFGGLPYQSAICPIFCFGFSLGACCSFWVRPSLKWLAGSYGTIFEKFIVDPWGGEKKKKETSKFKIFHELFFFFSSLENLLNFLSPVIRQGAYKHSLINVWKIKASPLRRLRRVPIAPWCHVTRNLFQRVVKALDLSPSGLSPNPAECIFFVLHLSSHKDKKGSFNNS